MVFFLAFLFVIGLVAELLSLRAGLKRIHFRYSPLKLQVEQGEQIPVAMEVHNRGLRPMTYILAKVYFPIAAQLPEKVVTEIDHLHKEGHFVFRNWGFQRRRRTVYIRIEKRGVHYFSGAELERTDFIGIRKATEKFPHKEQVLVYPRCVDNPQLISAMGEFYGEMEAQRHLLRDPILTIGMREYTGREPMKTISWTQSARRGQLMVREFDFIRDLSCTVILATDGMMPNRGQRLDNCCSIVRTICQELCNRGVNVDFYTNSPIEGYGVKNRRMWKCTATPENQEDLLIGLARLSPGPANSPADTLAAAAIRAVGERTAFVVVAPFENENIAQMVRTLEEYSGRRTLLIRDSDYFAVKKDQG